MNTRNVDGPLPVGEMPDLMTVAEVSAFLRVRQRTIYELVRTQRIPNCKLSGRLLFPKRLIDLWVLQSSYNPSLHLETPPAVVAGSHDPLLEWAARESGCGLALLVGGSAAGLSQILDGLAMACAVHQIDPISSQTLPGLDFVALEWARRQQGLVVAAGNPANITSVQDLRKGGVRVVVRQEGSGSGQLFARLVGEANLQNGALSVVRRPASSETDVAVAVRQGEADAGMAIAAAAHDQGIDFVPLLWERFDLIVRRVEFFEPPMQRLLAFARTDLFREKAAALSGYDIEHTGSVVFNVR